MRCIILGTMVLILLGCPKDDVEATYEFPDVFTGFVIAKDRVSVPVGFELWDTKRITGDVLIAEDLVSFGLCWRATSLYEIKFGAFYGYDFAQSRWVPGAQVLFLKF